MQGVQAQTVANFLLAFDGGLSIIPVINKVCVCLSVSLSVCLSFCLSVSPSFMSLCYTLQIDLSSADVPMVVEQIGNAFGFVEDDILKVKHFLHSCSICRVLY